MTTHETFIFSSLLIALLVNGAAGYALPPTSPITWIITYLILSYMGVASAYLFVKHVLRIFTSGRYAVEAFILDKENRLLLYRHGYHKVMLPPGGRLKFGEFPTDGLEKRLKERLQLDRNEYEYIDLSAAYFQHDKGTFSSVQRLPTPFIVQKEVVRQRRFKRFHYDFVYVLRLNPSHRGSFAGEGYDPIQFVNLEQLKGLEAKDETFPDVVDAYQRIIDLAKIHPSLSNGPRHL
jgi:hypothetical protein